MGKTAITRACGHEETVTIGGPVNGRDAKLAHEATLLCQECWQAERSRQAAALQESGESAGLPALEGSPKQIAWAVTIRAKLLREVEEWQAYLTRQVESLGGIERLSEQDRGEAERMEAAIAAARREAGASWWIDRRSCSAKMIIKEGMK